MKRDHEIRKEVEEAKDDKGYGQKSYLRQTLLDVDDLKEG